MRRRSFSGGQLFELETKPLVRTLVISYRGWPFLSRSIPDDQAAVVIKDARVVALTSTARKLGVSIGDRAITLASSSFDLICIEDDFDFDMAAFEKVVAVAESFCPEVEVFSPGVCGFNVKGPSRYFGGEKALLSKVIDALSELSVSRGSTATSLVKPPTAAKDYYLVSEMLSNLSFGVGLADGPFVAKVASTFSAVVETGSSREFIAPFPVGILIDEGDVDTLSKVGVNCVGQILDIPRDLMVERFGKVGSRLYELARGVDGDLVEAREVKKRHHVRIELDPPETLSQAISFAIRAKVDDFFSSLTNEGIYPLRVRISFETETTEAMSRVWSSSVPISPSFLISYARRQLEGWQNPAIGQDPPRSGIIYCDIEVMEITSTPFVQLDLYQVAIHPQDKVLRAIERARDKVGDGAIKVPRKRAGRSPRDQFQLLNWQLDLFEEESKGDAAKENPPWPGQVPNVKPSMVFDPVVEMEMTSEGGLVVGVSSSGELTCSPKFFSVPSLGWKKREIERILGPWPMNELWWDDARRRRLARVQIVSCDGVALNAVMEASKWHLEAIYD